MILPRISSVILLVAAMLALSGIVATAVALAHAEDAVACCDNDSQEKDSAPCSVPDCPCASCLSIEFVAPPAFAGGAAAGADFSPHRQLFFLSEFICSIDYPPETC